MQYVDTKNDASEIHYFRAHHLAGGLNSNNPKAKDFRIA